MKSATFIFITKTFSTHTTALEVKLADNFLLLLHGRSSQRCRVEIVKLIKAKQLRHVGEGLIAYSEHNLISLLDFVNDVMANFCVFPKNKSIL